MRTWRLDRPAEVYRRMSPTTDFGGQDDRDELICPTWVRIMPLKVDEKRHADQVYGSATHRIICRRPPQTITPKDWVISQGNRYEIVGVVELDGFREYLDMTVTEEPVHDASNSS